MVSTIGSQPIGRGSIPRRGIFMIVFVMHLDNLNLHEIVGANSLAKKYVKYDFQELGLMIAKKLNDENRKSFYIKLAKYENRELLMNAFTYALYNNDKSSLGKLFLWKLKKLRQEQTFRAFVAIFPIKWKSNIKNILIRVKEKMNFTPFPFKLIPLEKLHITFQFFDALPASLFFPLSMLIEAFYKQREDYFETSLIANRVRLWFVNSRYYLIIDDFDSNTYRIYYSFIKFIKNSKLKYADRLVKIFNKSKNKFFPHITLARLNRFNRNNLLALKQSGLDIIRNIEIKFDPCITLATSNFMDKKYNRIYYSLNYGIGGCWHRKNL